MNNLDERIKIFVELGIRLKELINRPLDDAESNKEGLLYEVEMGNRWFTAFNIRYAIEALATMLTETNLRKWLAGYPELAKTHQPKTIGVVMAGNIPLVGFHDLLCVLLSGNKALIKLSSKDDKLMKYISAQIVTIQPQFSGMIEFADIYLQNFDAIIATGSNNTSRYFEYYFAKYPNIIRKNRSSVAVLTGSETDADLHNLADDIFVYFGLGCRNVSKLYLPMGFDISRIFRSFEHYSFVLDNTKYANNYDYHKAIFLVNQEPFLDNNFVILKEDQRITSPVAIVYFEYYTNLQTLMQNLELLRDQLQCIVGNETIASDIIPFGKSQKPELFNYADNVDTMKFLLSLNDD